MKEIRILVTGVGGDIGQGVLKCLRDADHSLIITGCDTDPYAVTKDEVHSFKVSPLLGQADEYGKFIDGIIAEGHIDYILPLSEPEIRYFDAHRALFEKNARLLINSHEVLNKFMDKYLTYEFFKDLGVKVPETILLNDFKGNIPYPFVIKPRGGCGSKGMAVINDQNEFDSNRAFYRDGIIQESVGTKDEEYTMAVFSDGRSVHSIAFRRKLGYGSLTRYAELINDKALTDIAVKTARAIKLDGAINIQLRKHNGEYMPFEVNARLSSTVRIRHHFGFNDVCWWIDRYEGKPIEYRLKYSSGKAVRRIDEVFFDLAEVDS